MSCPLHTLLFVLLSVFPSLSLASSCRRHEPPPAVTCPPSSNTICNPPRPGPVPSDPPLHPPLRGRQRYYNSKQFKEDDPEQALAGFAKVGPPPFIAALALTM